MNQISQWDVERIAENKARDMKHELNREISNLKQELQDLRNDFAELKRRFEEYVDHGKVTHCENS